MKKTTSIFLFTSLCFFILITGVKGENPFRALTNTFRNQDQLQFSELGEKTIRLYIKEKSPSPDAQQVLSRIKQLNILNFKGNKQFNISQFVENFNRSYPVELYTPINVRKDSAQCKMVYIKETNDKITDLLVAEVIEQKVSLVEIKGDIDLEHIALLKDALNIEGLSPIQHLGKTKEGIQSFPDPNAFKLNKYNTPAFPYQPRRYKAPTNGFRPWLLADSEPGASPKKGKGIEVYDRFGNKYVDAGHDPVLLINGYSSSTDYRSSLQRISPECIQSINVLKNGNPGNLSQSGTIEINLKGSANQAFTICDGILYFGQDGQIKMVDLTQEDAPKLLLDCQERPLCEIENINPEKVGSIQLTHNPRKCKGKTEGNFVVVESK